MSRISLISFVILIVGCSGPKRAAKSLESKDIYQNFFIENDVNQWYIHPLRLTSEHGVFLVDFTFRDNIVETGDSVSLKYSILSENSYKKPADIVFELKEGLINLSNSNKIYVEVKDDIYHYRYINTLHFEDFKKIIGQLKSAKLAENGDAFLVGSKAEKKLAEIQQRVVDVVGKY